MGRLPRLPGWDYSTPAAYFITFKVHERRRVLSRVSHGNVHLSAPGRIVLTTARLLPERFSGLTIDRLVIMPDHIHAILVLEGGCETSVPCPTIHQRSSTVPASFMGTSKTAIGKVVRHWKARSTRLIRLHLLPEFRWQSRHWDRVIRDGAELWHTRRYIELNPLRWQE